MNNSEKIVKLLEKYELTKEIPESIQDHIYSDQKKSLKKIFKQKNSYNIATSLLISIKIIFRRFGIRTNPATGKNMKRAVAFTAALITFISLYTLKEKLFMKTPEEGQKIILSRGQVDIMQNKHALSAEINDSVPDNAIIKTGMGSHIFFQNSTISLTGVMENSEAEIISWSNDTGSVINLRKGLLLARVEKLRKNQNYIVRTPNSVTIVRGTAFSVKYYNDISEVALAAGKIVVKDKTGNKKILNKGETAIISDTITYRKISEIELLQIQKITLITFLKDSSGEKSFISKKKARHYEAEIKKIDKKIEELVEKEKILKESELDKWKRLPPLERLRRQGKFITMFHMRDGSRVAGSILSQNESAIKLDTGDGIIKISKKEIIRRQKIE
jgi:hypothetical protein